MPESACKKGTFILFGSLVSKNVSVGNRERCTHIASSTVLNSHAHTHTHARNHHMQMRQDISEKSIVYLAGTNLASVAKINLTNVISETNRRCATAPQNQSKAPLQKFLICGGRKEKPLCHLLFILQNICLTVNSCGRIIQKVCSGKERVGKYILIL